VIELTFYLLQFLFSLLRKGAANILTNNLGAITGNAIKNKIHDI
jgi:hypothetical protein